KVASGLSRAKFNVPSLSSQRSMQKRFPAIRKGIPSSVVIRGADCKIHFQRASRRELSAKLIRR
ncbi:hypothetical protein E2562_000564, partial [Oryza meyeriana var. granulata]